MWFQCRTAWGDVPFPDGRPLLDQPVRLIRAWGIIGAEVRYWDKLTEKQR